MRLHDRLVCFFLGHTPADRTELHTHCLRCGVGLGLPVTQQTITMPPVLPPRQPSFTRLPPTVAEFERTPEAQAIRRASAVSEVQHGPEVMAVSVMVTDRGGVINSDILTNENPSAKRLAKAITATIANVEAWK